jgi:hypothetical protein
VSVVAWHDGDWLRIVPDDRWYDNGRFVAEYPVTLFVHSWSCH